MDEQSADAALATWFVMSATRAQVINLVAALYADLTAIDHILVLVGKDGSEPGTQQDLEQASRPLRWFQQALLHELGETGRNRRPSVDYIVADKDDLNGWRDRLFSYFMKQSDCGLIVHSYLGGTTDMSIGSYQGLELLSAARPHLRIEPIAKHQKRVSFPRRPDQNIAIRDGFSILSREGYLLCNGYKETQAVGRVAREAQALARWPVTKELANLIFSGDSQLLIDGRARLLNSIDMKTHIIDIESAIQRSLDKHPKLREGLSPAISVGGLEVELRAFAPRLVKCLLRLGDVAVDRPDCPGTVLLRSKESAHFCIGDWFEDWVWLTLRESLDGKAWVGLGLKIQEWNANTPDWDAELDVAIYCNNQLHAIECKSGTSGKRQAREELHKAATHRQRVLTMYGKSIVCRVVGLSDTDRNYEEASRLSTNLHAGKSEIFEMLSSLPRALLH